MSAMSAPAPSSSVVSTRKQHSDSPRNRRPAHQCVSRSFGESLARVVEVSTATPVVVVAAAAAAASLQSATRAMVDDRGGSRTMAMFAFLLDPGRAAAASVAARACSNCSQVVSAASICKRLEMRNLGMPKNANSNVRASSLWHGGARAPNRRCHRRHPCGRVSSAAPSSRWPSLPPRTMGVLSSRK